MPNYKAVNADQLDADITTVADAIREKAGTSGKMAFPNGMADAVRNIQSGVEIPELSNPASPEDMVSGKSLYDHTGKKVDGAVKEVDNTYFTPWQNANIEFDDGWIIGSILDEDVLLRSGTVVNVSFNNDVFGNAFPEHVQKGFSFTSHMGVKQEGTMEPGETNFYHYRGDVVAYEEDGAVGFEHTFDKDCYYPNGGKIVLFNADLGDALPQEVVKGRTFTTSKGVKIEGTMEPGSGGVQMSVDGETLVITGAATFENGTLIL